ncbi:hypothetical protein EVAR_67786_1 [Eumeta japonica]|uniref:Secreted protein n=1 Tax=Eumeta variegata TaxID=151549 RepID=A0A4C1ZWI8_EUMVA|nr:hypothetical protein EVAR_67786_1 [Eumeta japonica]
MCKTLKLLVWEHFLLLFSDLSSRVGAAGERRPRSRVAAQHLMDTCSGFPLINLKTHRSICARRRFKPVTYRFELRDFLDLGRGSETRSEPSTSRSCARSFVLQGDRREGRFDCGTPTDSEGQRGPRAPPTRPARYREGFQTTDARSVTGLRTMRIY